jgi:hypothetical protein
LSLLSDILVLLRHLAWVAWMLAGKLMSHVKIGAVVESKYSKAKVLDAKQT